MCWLIGVAALVVVVVAGVRAWAVRSAAPRQPVAGATGSVSFSSDVTIATLYSPSGEARLTGIATRQFVDVVFIHGITATLPDLPPDQFYAGWLFLLD